MLVLAVKKHTFKVSFLKIFSFALLAGCSLLATAPYAEGQTMIDFDLEWDAVSASDLAGYVVYWGYESRRYRSSVNVGNKTSYTVRSAERGKTYYFAVTAYDLEGNESAFSNEVSRTISEPSPNDTDGDGIPNSIDTDDDNDGLSDIEEALYGTDPLRHDTDGDGVSDGQEVSDGSNPLDRGSFISRGSQTVCALWNSFLGMWNVFEHLSFANTPLTVFSRLNNITGEQADSFVFHLAANTQRDILIHDNTTAKGLSNSYGKVCSSHNGNAGDLRGTMVYYRPNTSAGSTAAEFQYALALPVTEGLVGEQTVTFNTFPPSWYWVDWQNLPANWISIINRSAYAGTGTLTFYDLAGHTLANLPVSLAAGERTDISGHQFGLNITGYVLWVPNDLSQRFELKNLRYIYDNPGVVESFDTAFQIDGFPGSGALLTVPLDTIGRSAILEISNVLNKAVSVMVEVYSSEGNHLSSMNYQLAPRESVHKILDDTLVNSRGIATIKGSDLGSIYTILMQYDRRTDGGINYMYGIPGSEALGSVLRTSYNTFLSQNSELWLTNPHDTSLEVSFSMVRSDGTTMVLGHTVSVPAHGLSVVDLNQFESADNYGVLTIQPKTLTPVAWVKRRKSGEFVIPTRAQE